MCPQSDLESFQAQGSQQIKQAGLCRVQVKSEAERKTSTCTLAHRQHVKECTSNTYLLHYACTTPVHAPAPARFRPSQITDGLGKSSRSRCRATTIAVLREARVVPPQQQPHVPSKKSIPGTAIHAPATRSVVRYGHVPQLRLLHVDGHSCHGQREGVHVGEGLCKDCGHSHDAAEHDQKSSYVQKGG